MVVSMVSLMRVTAGVGSITTAAPPPLLPTMLALTLVVEGADKKRETIEVKAAVKPLGDTKH